MASVLGKAKNRFSKSLFFIATANLTAGLGVESNPRRRCTSAINHQPGMGRMLDSHRSGQSPGQSILSHLDVKRAYRGFDLADGRQPASGNSSVQLPYQRL